MEHREMPHTHSYIITPLSNESFPPDHTNFPRPDTRFQNPFCLRSKCSKRSQRGEGDGDRAVIEIAIKYSYQMCK